MTIVTTFQPELIAGATIDYQIQVKPIGNFPAELSSVLLTGAFPLSPSPTATGIKSGLKIFTYQQRYLCFCYFFQGGKRDEHGRQTSSSRVLIFPLELWHSPLPVLSDVREWLERNDLENMNSDRFYTSLLSLANSSLSPTLRDKAQQTQWFPQLLVQSIQHQQVTLVAPTEAEAIPWLEILWYYLPDFLRLKLEWCTFVWSLQSDREHIVAARGEVETPSSPSFLQQLFPRSKPKSNAKLYFDVARGISSQNSQLKNSQLLEWLCRELISQEPWENWQLEEQNKFLVESLVSLTRNPRIKPDELIAGYPQNSKLQEFLSFSS